MALTARQLVFYIRAENQASGTLRRVASDIRGLQRLQGLQIQQRQVQAQLAGLEARSRGLALERSSLETGSRALALQKQRANLERTIATRRDAVGRAQTAITNNERAAASAANRRLNVESRLNTLGTTQLRNANALSNAYLSQAKNQTALADAQLRHQRASRIVTARGSLKGFTAEESATQLSILQNRINDLTQAQAVLNERVAVAKAAIAGEDEALERLARDAANASLAEERLAASTQHLQANLSRAQAALAGTALEERVVTERAIEAEIALQNLGVEEQKLALQTEVANSRFREIGRTMATVRPEQLARGFRVVGRTLQLTGVAAAFGMGIAAHSAANFNTEITLAATQARKIGAPISQTADIATRLTKESLDLMRQFPATSQEIADSFYQIFSGSSATFQQAVQWEKVFNQEAVAGAASLESMTQAGLTIFNNFPGEFNNMTQAGNKFFAAVRFGRMTADQFAQALGYIAPIAKDAGQSFKNVAEDMAFFTRQTGGRMTRQDAQGLARLIQLFGRSDVQRGLQMKGISVFDNVGKMRPIVEILGEIHDKLKLTPQETLNFFKTISAAGGKAGTAGTIQAIRIFSQAINNGESYREVVNNVRRDNDELEKSFLAMSKTPGVQWKTFTNQLHVLAITIGTQAIPAIMEIGRPVGQAISWFNGLSDEWKRAIALATTFGAVGAILGGTLLSIAGSVAQLVIAWKLMRAANAEANLAALGSSRGFAGLLDETGSLRIGVALLIPVMIALGYILVKHPEYIHKITQAMGGFKGVLMALSILIAGFTLANLVRWFTTAGTAAAVAEGKVARLRLGLLGIASITIPAIVIPILFKAGEAPTQAPVGQQHIKTAGGLLGMFDKVVMGAEMLANKHIKGMTTAESRQDIIEGHGGGPGSRVVVDMPTSSQIKKYEDILSSPLISDSQVHAAAAAIQRNDTATLNKIWKTTQLVPGKGSPIRGRNTAGPPTSRAPLAPGQSAQAQEANWRKLFNNAQRLDSIAKAQPKNMQAQERAIKSMNKLQAASTDVQFQAAQEVIGATNSAAKKASSISTGAFHTQVANLKRLAMYAKAHPQDIDAGKRYYDAMAKFSNDASEAQQQAAQAAIDATVNAEKKGVSSAASAAKKAASDAKGAINTMAQNLTGTYNEMLQQNQSALGQLFSGPMLANYAEWGATPTGKMLKQDLDRQITMFTTWSDNIEKLRKRGAPQELVKQIRDLGLSPASQAQVAALTKMSPAMWNAYIKDFQKGQDLVKNQTQRDLNAQLKIYRSHGANIAKAIISGVRSQDIGVENVIRNMVIKMFPELAKRAKLKPVGDVGNIGRHAAPVVAAAAKQAAKAPVTAPRTTRALQTGRHTSAPTISPRIVLPKHVKGESHYHEAPIHVEVRRDQADEIITGLKHTKFYYRNKRQLGP